MTISKSFLGKLLAALLMICILPGFVFAEEPEPARYEIITPEDLFTICEDPTGIYELANDLDMTGYEWRPIDFSGRLEGNGHAILNLSVSGVSDSHAITYDGNRKPYDTYFSGMFGCLVDAEISDLKLLNIRAFTETDLPCFLGSFAGYSDHSMIINCEVNGILELRAHDRMFGVGGIVGYGNGMIEQSKADMTLICTDTDPGKKDEQFLGGAYAAGYVDLVNNQIIVDGYDSDHGYVHNGGAVGMYIQYPLETNVKGYINGNTVTGKITFFEDNYDRRAYCEAYVGETMNWRYQQKDNTASFVRDERFVYDVELRPEMCTDPTYTETMFAFGCDDYGYTEYVCDSCGYTYKDNYTPLVHSVTNWSVVTAATVEDEGVSSGECDKCGALQERTVPRIEPTEPATVPETLPPAEATEAIIEQSAGEKDNRIPVYAAIGAVLIAIGGTTAYCLLKKR